MIVGKEVYINARACHCDECKGPQKKLCRSVVIERKGKKLEIKRYSADARNSVTTWDLALLRRPQHASLQKMVSLSTVKYLVLGFPTVQGKIFAPPCLAMS